MYQCPRCTATMETTRYEGVEVETCPVCEGEWLDAEELRQIIDRVERRFDPEEVQAMELSRKQTFRIQDHGPDRLSCPKCPGGRLHPFNYASTSGVILDKCPRCGGIWLDRGELEVIQALVDHWNRELSRGSPGGARAARKIEIQTETEVRVVGQRSRFAYILAVLRSFV